MRKFTYNRTLLFVLTLVLILSVALALFRPGSQDPRGMSEAEFVWRKINMTHSADVVLAGDSRMANNVSPGHVAQAFPDLKVLNCAFKGQKMSEKYFRYLTGCLKPDSREKTIVIGLSNTNLYMVDEKVFASDFDSYAPEEFHSALAFRLTDMFAPLSGPEMNIMLRRPSGVIRYQIMHPDGWIELVAEDKKSYFSGWLEKVVPKDNSEKINEGVAFLERWSAHWSKLGIRVIFFQQPLDEDTWKVATLQGYNKERIKKQLTAAGALWLEDVPKTDGAVTLNNYLESDSAKLFSTALGQNLAPLLGR